MELLAEIAFKYISCYCLSKKPRFGPKTPKNSNTSHVIVYPKSPVSGQKPPKIQIHLMLLFIIKKAAGVKAGKDSNTSHVIVYLDTSGISPKTDIFKYISCYCLSAFQENPIVTLTLFKYISCYCLSYMSDSYYKGKY